MRRASLTLHLLIVTACASNCVAVDPVVRARSLPTASLEMDDAHPLVEVAVELGSPTGDDVPPPVGVPATTPTGPTSEPLACGLHNPMPGAYAAGYLADTGLDLAGMGQPVFAIAAGQVDYAEAGHTAWTSPTDDDRAIRIELDEPIKAESGSITHVWYAHLAELAFEQAESAKSRRRVAAGEYLGKSGRANGMYHLHMGLLIGGETSQAWGTYLLEDEVREVLCGLRHKSRLPLLASTLPTSHPRDGAR